MRRLPPPEWTPSESCRDGSPRCRIWITTEGRQCRNRATYGRTCHDHKGVDQFTEPRFRPSGLEPPGYWRPVDRWPRGHRWARARHRHHRCQSWARNAGRQCLALANLDSDYCSKHQPAKPKLYRDRGIESPGRDPFVPFVRDRCIKLADGKRCGKPAARGSRYCPEHSTGRRADSFGSL